MARARRLIAASGSQRIRVDVWAPRFFSRQAAPVAQARRKLGFPSRVRVFEDLTYDYLRPPHLAINMLLIDDRGALALGLRRERRAAAGGGSYLGRPAEAARGSPQ